MVAQAFMTLTIGREQQVNQQVVRHPDVLPFAERHFEPFGDEVFALLQKVERPDDAPAVFYRRWQQDGDAFGGTQGAIQSDGVPAH